jgi:quercetin dioxygenase-like cupin family protein
LDEGQGFSEHTAPFVASCSPLKGVAGKPIPLKAGDLVLLPAEKPHAVMAITRFKMVLTLICS